MKESVFSIIVSVGVLIVVFVGFNYFLTSQWSLFYYPDGCLGCEDKWIITLDTYDTKEKCRDAGFVMQEQNNGRGDAFECGYKCKSFGDGGYLCKETVDY